MDSRRSVNARTFDNDELGVDPEDDADEDEDDLEDENDEEEEDEDAAVSL